MNNPLLKLFTGYDTHKLQKEWENFANQETIEIVDQGITTIQQDNDHTKILIALWYRWVE